MRRNVKSAAKSAKSAPASVRPYSDADLCAAYALQKGPAKTAFAAAVYFGSCGAEGGTVPLFKAATGLAKSGGTVSLIGSCGRANGGKHETKSLCGRGFLENSEGKEKRTGAKAGTVPAGRFYPLGPAIAALALSEGKVSAEELQAAKAACEPAPAPAK